MRYLCLLATDETIYPRMPKPEAEKLMGEFVQLRNDLKASGHYLGGERLQPTSSATTVRVRDGKTLTTDGPFAETKEQLGGFFLIEAEDLNSAIQLAARIPSARFGSVEVRPIAPVPA